LHILDKEENEKYQKKVFGMFGKYFHYLLGSSLGFLCFMIFVLIKKNLFNKKDKTQ
jgi:hypothetical protein